MNNEPVKKFMDKITDTSEIPFAMATLDKNGDIKEFGPYQIDFAHEIPHIPLYTHPAKTYEDAIEECAQRAEAYAYMSPNFTALAEELRAILRKAQE